MPEILISLLYFLLLLLVLGIVVYATNLIIGMFNWPPPVKNIALLIVGVVVLAIILGGVLPGGYPTIWHRP